MLSYCHGQISPRGLPHLFIKFITNRLRNKDWERAVMPWGELCEQPQAVLNTVLIEQRRDWIVECGKEPLLVVYDRIIKVNRIFIKTDSQLWSIMLLCDPGNLLVIFNQWLCAKGEKTCMFSASSQVAATWWCEYNLHHYCTYHHLFFLLPSINITMWIS